MFCESEDFLLMDKEIKQSNKTCSIKKTIRKKIHFGKSLKAKMIYLLTWSI